VIVLATTTTVLVEHAGSDTAEWLTAIGTIGATLVALAFGVGLRERLSRPKVGLRFSADNISDQLLTSTVLGVRSAWVRLRVANDGRTAAERVRVSVLGAERRSDETWEQAAPEVVGATLRWSNRPNEPTLDIPPRSERPLDLFSILGELANQGELPMELAIGPVVPANNAHRLAPGGWRLLLEVSADNTPPVTAYMSFRFDGYWTDNVWQTIAVAGPSRNPPAEPPTPELRDPQEMLAEAAAEQRQDEPNSRSAQSGQ